MVFAMFGRFAGSVLLRYDEGHYAMLTIVAVGAIGPLRSSSF
jgi:fucose permease